MPTARIRLPALRRRPNAIAFVRRHAQGGQQLVRERRYRFPSRPGTVLRLLGHREPIGQRRGRIARSLHLSRELGSQRFQLPPPPPFQPRNILLPDMP